MTIHPEFPFPTTQAFIINIVENLVFFLYEYLLGARFSLTSKITILRDADKLTASSNLHQIGSSESLIRNPALMRLSV